MNCGVCNHREVCRCFPNPEEYCSDYEPERPHGEWIPCSERLPTEEDYRPCYGLPDGCVMWQTDNGDIGFRWYYDSTKCWSDIYDPPIKTGKVVAWMPLPKSYKAESKGVKQ